MTAKRRQQQHIHGVRAMSALPDRYRWLSRGNSEKGPHPDIAHCYSITSSAVASGVGAMAIADAIYGLPIPGQMTAPYLFARSTSASSDATNVSPEYR